MNAASATNSAIAAFANRREPAQKMRNPPETGSFLLGGGEYACSAVYVPVYLLGWNSVDFYVRSRALKPIGQQWKWKWKWSKREQERGRREREIRQASQSGKWQVATHDAVISSSSSISRRFGEVFFFFCVLVGTRTLDGTELTHSKMKIAKTSNGKMVERSIDNA